MYSAPYGYANPAGGQPFNGAPQGQNPHMQPGPSPGQPQQMMYNTQQFPMGGQPGHFPPGPNPAMMGPAGPAGMMQNAAMPHMAANGQMAYQTPYTSSPYGPGISSAAAPQVQLPGNYMMAGGMAPYQMSPGMPQQQPPQSMMPRMHAAQNQQNMSVATPQRPFNPAQGTPGNPMTSQAPQYSTPQAQAPPQSQTPTNAHQTPSAAATPQTPTFPPTGQQPQTNGTSTVSTPQSPVSDSRDKERFALLLDINQELLYESVTLFNSKMEVKKAQVAVEGGTLSPDGDLAEEENILTQDYSQCMRRIQVNLAYLAAMADRKNVRTPAPPTVLTPPALNLGIKLRVSSEEAPEKMPDPNADREERDRLMKHLYSKLQALFPDVDPKKEAPAVVSNPRPSNPQQQNPQQQNSQQNPQQQTPQQRNPQQQAQAQMQAQMQMMQQQHPNPQMQQQNQNPQMLPQAQKMHPNPQMQLHMQQQMEQHNQHTQAPQMAMKAPPNGQMMGSDVLGSDHGSPAPGSHGQNTPQMANASAPQMHA